MPTQPIASRANAETPEVLPSIPGLKKLWAETLGDPEITIAVLDGPVDVTHPVFQGANLSVLPTQGAKETPGSDHGTHVSSIVFGQHEGPLRGVAPACRGLIAPVYSQDAAGTLIPCSQMDLARAIDHAANQGALVINISGGQLTHRAEANAFLADAVKRCAQRNILIVSAVGNDGCECIHVPAALPSVLAVGAVDLAGRPLPFSNWGAAVEKQGIAAPGISIPGAVPGGGLSLRSGTSFATPIVTGVVGLLLSLQRQRGQSPDPARVRAALLESALPCDPSETRDCARLLAGRLNLPGAWRLLFPRHRRLPAGMQKTVPSVGVSLAGAASPALQQVHPSGLGEVRAVPLQAQKVFALGQLAYDFGSETRREYFIQQLGGKASTPFDPLRMAEYLKQHPQDAKRLTWILKLDATPLYALEPQAPHAVLTFQRLSECLIDQELNGVERLSLAGPLTGTTKLLDGTVLPTVAPELRGLFNWNTESLITACYGVRPAEGDSACAHYDAQAAHLRFFLDRIYHGLRNTGASPRSRALNFAATNAFQCKEVFADAIQENLVLETVDVEPSTLCRPNSDCWDIQLRFFDPKKRYYRARKAYRYTVDLSDYVPVTVGTLRMWFID